MKKLLLAITVLAITSTVVAQGNSQNNGKGKSKNHGKSAKSGQVKDNEGSWDAPNGNYGPGKSSKNQPKKVQAALLRDYPNAGNVHWTKYKGDYTATFNNGPWRSTAVYHANGERRDTRTPLTRQQLPGSIWDVIFKRDRIVPTRYVQIDRPSTAERIFRIVTASNAAYYYNENGVRVQYDY